MVCEYNAGPTYLTTAGTNVSNTLTYIAPATQASNLNFSNIQTTQLTASWTNGNGADRAVFIYKGSSGSAAPVNNTTYTANTVYGSGTQIGASGWYCIYNGIGTTVTVTGLAVGTSYMVMVCEYNAGPTYLTTAGTNVANTTTLKLNQTITFTLASPKAFSAGTLALTATATSGLGVTYSSSNTSVATVTGSTLTYVGLGKTGITASQAGNASYNAATQVTDTLVVTVGSQTITFPGIAAKLLTSPDFSPGATTNSGLKLSYTSNNLGVATITAGGLIHIVGAGTASITAFQGGNANFNPAAPVTSTFSVTAGTAQTITFNALPTNKLPGSADFSPGATASSGLTVTYTSSNLSVATITAVNLIHIVGFGSANITAIQPGNVSYSPAAPVTKPLTVGVQTITFSAIPVQIPTNADFSPGASASSGLLVTYSSSNLSVATITAGGFIHLVGVGTSTITASQNGNSSWGAATPVNQTLTVSGQTITFPAIPAQLLTSPDFSPGATASSGLQVTYTSNNYSVATITAGGLIHIVGGGTANITASQPGNTSVGAAASITNPLTVGVQTITFPALPANKIVGSADFSPGATVAPSGLTISYTSSNPGVATITAGGLIHIIGVGTTNITASQAGNTSYSAAIPVMQSLTVGVQTITFVAFPANLPLNSYYYPGATSSSGLPVTYTSDNTSVAVITSDSIYIVGNGTANITASQAGNATYAPAAPVTKALTVGMQTITFPTLPVNLAVGAKINPGATASSGLQVTYTSSNYSVAAIVNDSVYIVGIGTANITAFQVGNANYSPAAQITNPITTIGAQAITFPNLPVNEVLGSPEFNPGATASSGLQVTYTSSNLSVATIVNDSIRIVGSGTTIITASQAGNASWGAATPLTQNLNVGVQTITFPNIATQILGNPDFSPGATSSSGLQVSYTSSNLGVATITAGGLIHIVGIGTSTITASQPGNASYSAAVIQTKTLTVAGQIITFPAIPAQLLNSPDFSPGATASSGLTVTYTSSNTSVATITAAGLIHIVGGGTANITANQAGNASISAAAAVTNSLTVGVQTITFPAIAAKTLASLNFSPGATASPSGLTVIYTSSNPSVATIVNDSVHIVGLGTSQITASQPGNASYSAAAPVIQVLTVGGQTITFNAFPVNIPAGTNINPGATASSGLQVTYTSDNTSVATVVGNMIDIVGIGTADITASQAGNATYNAAVPVVQSLKAGYQIITFPAIPLKILTSANFSPAATASSGLPVTYSSDNLSVATIVNDSVHIVGGGTANITANQSGNASFGAAAPVIKGLTVGVQTITFTAIPAKLLNSPNFSPGATASSGLPVIYTSSNLSVATIVNDSVRIVGSGTTTITASQPGNAFYSAATPATQNFTAGVQTITFPNIPVQIPTNPDFSPGATASSGLPVTYTSSILTVATITAAGLIHIVGTGSSTITAMQAGNASYGEATNQAKTLTVASQFITFPAISAKLLNSPNFSPGATASSGLPVTYTSSNLSVATIVNDSVHIVGGGTTNITANQPGNGTYGAATSVTNNFTVGVQTITFPGIAGKTLASVDFSPGATASPSGLPVTYTSSNTSVATITAGGMVHIVGNGTSTITANQSGNASYSAATPATQVLTVGGQTITFPLFPVNLPLNVYISPGATASSGLAVTYTSSNSSIATIVGNMVYIVDTGKVIITANQAGNATWTAATPVTQSLNVGVQTITFPGIPAKLLNSPDFSPGATASSGLTVTYSSNNISVATVTAGGLIHIVGGGQVTITASQPGNSSYSAATPQTMSFNAGVQTITFPPLPTNDVVGSPYINPGATSTSGLTVNYSSSNSNVAEIVGGLILIDGVGTATITASQSGNASYAPATNATQNITVLESNQTITFPPLVSVEIIHADFNPGATASSLLPVSYTTSNPLVATIVNGMIHLVGVGTVNIIASQSGDQNYYAAPNVSQPLVVTIANQTLYFNPLPEKTYGDPNFSPGATVTSNLLITYTSDNTNVAAIVNDSIHITGAGTANIKASQPGNNNYNPANSITQLLTVFQKSQYINFQTFTGKYYGTPDFSPGASATSGLTVAYTSRNANVATIVNGKVHINEPGTVDITASQAGDTDYLPASEVTHVLTIYQDTQVITFNSINALDTLTYLDPDVSLVATTTAPLLAVSFSSNNTSIATIVNNKLHIIKPGSVAIIASQPGNIYYAPATEVKQIITINKAKQAISFEALPSINFSDTTIVPAVSSSSGLTITLSSDDPSVASIYNGKIQVHSAGSINITASQTGNAYYDTALNVVQTLTINKANQVITFGPIPLKTYGNPDFDPGAKSQVGLPIYYISGDTNIVDIVNGKAHIIKAGTTTITAMTNGNGNYNPTSYTQIITIDKASQILTFTALPTKSFGDSAFNLNAWVNTGLPINYTSNDTNVAKIVGGLVNIIGTGTAKITANQPGNTDYMAISAVQVLTVYKELQTITFNPLPTETYGDPDFSPGAFSSSGLQVSYSSDNTDVATILNGSIHIVGAGTANIKAYQSGNINFSQAISLTEQLTVNPVNQTITFNALPIKTFGDADFSVTATSSSGLKVYFSSDNASVATIVNGNIHITGAGIANIIASVNNDSDYYSGSVVKQQLTINKENQVIAFANLPVKTYGDSDFNANATSTSGLDISYTSDNDSVAIIVNNLIHIVGAGSAHITASQYGNNDYDAALNNTQFLNVTKASQTITFGIIPNQFYGNNDFKPGAVSSSGLPINYSSNNSNVATIEDGLIHIIGVGTAIITATQPGNTNFNTVTVNPQQTLTVDKAILTVTANNASRKYGDPNPAFTCWYIGFVNSDDYTDLVTAPVITTDATISSLPGKYDIIPEGGTDNNYQFVYVNGELTIGSNPPLKPGTPAGPENICINSPNQVFTTTGAGNANSYIWSISPSDAGIFSGTGKSVSLTFSNNFAGQCAISVTGQNPSGIGESSDSLVVSVVPLPDSVNISMKGTFCSNQSGDSIKILNSENGYIYQLYYEGRRIDTAIHGKGGEIEWVDLKQGTYNIMENVCNVPVANNLVIKEIANNSFKPAITEKWNNVVICLVNTDSVTSYEWFQNYIPVSGAHQQYYWTQQQQGYYSVKTTDLNGCQSLMSDSIFIQAALGTIYPNPCQGEFTITLSDFDNGKVSVKLYSLNSALLKSFNFDKEGESFQQQINVSGLAAGAYFVEVDLNSQIVIFEKLIIQ